MALPLYKLQINNIMVKRGDIDWQVFPLFPANHPIQHVCVVLSLLLAFHGTFVKTSTTLGLVPADIGCNAPGSVSEGF